tara:strand:- start:302 stop:880 length:579 start_codon:yes stop_codon:yes gene_type:complete
MAKSATTGTSISALVVEGKALGKMWNAINSVKQTTKANGFDTRLGKLLSELKAQSTVDSGQIPTHVLRTHGIANIDRRRRSEALWFFENQADCVEFMKASKKGYTSLSALQKAMKAASKEATVAKAKPSDVGQSDDKPTNLVQHSETKVSVPVTRSTMVNTIIKQCEANGLELEQVIEDLISKLALQERKAS